mmetsp:Transcript_53661/g.168901  ORF Transcript_53661/g.168901 Transcript_53661/m.168901 type:complete len:328 (+) Transcript_53661:141-1124(+)
MYLDAANGRLGHLAHGGPPPRHSPHLHARENGVDLLLQDRVGARDVERDRNALEEGTDPDLGLARVHRPNHRQLLRIVLVVGELKAADLDRNDVCGGAVGGRRHQLDHHHELLQGVHRASGKQHHHGPRLQHGGHHLVQLGLRMVAQEADGRGLRNAHEVCLDLALDDHGGCARLVVVDLRADDEHARQFLQRLWPCRRGTPPRQRIREMRPACRANAALGHLDVPGLAREQPAEGSGHVLHLDAVLRQAAPGEVDIALQVPELLLRRWHEACRRDRRELHAVGPDGRADLAGAPGAHQRLAGEVDDEMAHAGLHGVKQLVQLLQVI